MLQIPYVKEEKRSKFTLLFVQWGLKVGWEDKPIKASQAHNPAVIKLNLETSFLKIFSLKVKKTTWKEMGWCLCPPAAVEAESPGDRTSIWQNSENVTIY